MKKLIVLFGIPGCGKTTLAEAFIKKHPEFTRHDVFKYVEKYKDPQGVMEENYSIKSYREMYHDLEKIDYDVILEMGTNYPRFNLRRLKRLKDQKNLLLIFCLLAREESYRRAKARGIIRNFIFKDEYLIPRIHRNFPQGHAVRCDNLGLAYHKLDMKKDLEEQVNFLEDLV